MKEQNERKTMNYHTLSDEKLEQLLKQTIQDRKRLTKLELHLKEIQEQRWREAQDEYQIIND